MPLTSKWAGLAAALVAGFGVSAMPAHGSVVSEVAGGVSIPQPLGIAGDTLNRPVGAAAKVWFHFPDFLPEHLEPNFTAQYFQYVVQNVSGANGIQMNVGMLGFYGGATVWGSPTFLGIRPMIGGALGAVYDFMTFPGAAGWSSNSGTSFALRLEPGFDVTITGKLGLFFEFPMTLAFQKPANLAFWESSFALRWKL